MKYETPEQLFQSSGNVILADFRAARQLALKMNEKRAESAPPVRAGQLNAMGLIDEVMHHVFRLYERTVNPGLLRDGLASLEATQGGEALREVLGSFTDLFPPLAVHRGEAGPAEYLGGEKEGRKHPEVSLEEILMLHLANSNPAFRPFIELFDDARLARGTRYAPVISEFRNHLKGAPGFGPKGESILDILEAPKRAHPESLSAQLGYMRDSWGMTLSPEFRTRFLSSEDLIREDGKTYPAGGTGPVSMAVCPPPGGTTVDYPETQKFTSDTDWMPNIVLLAKNAYVWLHQLSERYGRKVSRLDEIPDDELDRLARRNFTSLWLIGVWERSSASEKIKRMAGNPEAAPSAYSLYDYEIAADLGGEEAFGNLAHRAWGHGIRLAADMVPNHTGVTSRWMREHPDYFIQSEYMPFPSYRFSGVDLSDDPAYQVRIEDGYWTKSDAAVVFQHIDNATGRLRYICHGNDGTNMPWNDTAQLDFLKAEVREAVIGKIMHVARKFSVIRFDAAMTLAKKHFQRLWYPRPGTGGDIPSRADHAMAQEDFDRLFPLEFWREVVDRVNREMPQTLLLAEAFWLLEGYFVRTLGMHRVYNSAFMHMMMQEDNAKYREAIRNTLHFEPGILQRYVNFMSNPDEKTAIEQFGDGDKYFGVATLMSTLPGLPMFAHGQLEGCREKYGMEYRRSYHSESPDPELVRRHEREICPLLGMRPLFSQTDNFELYDVVDGHGNVIEDIFAYSNMAGGTRAIVCYNNGIESHTGRLRLSVGKAGPGTDGGEGAVRRLNPAEALRLDTSPDMFVIFSELRSGLEYIRAGGDFAGDGFQIQLGGYHCQVFLDFRQVHDPDGSYKQLCAELDGGGVHSLEKSHRAISLRPLHAALRELFTPSGLAEMEEFSAGGKKKPVTELFVKKIDDVERALEKISPGSDAPSHDRSGPGGGTGVSGPLPEVTVTPGKPAPEASGRPRAKPGAVGKSGRTTVRRKHAAPRAGETGGRHPLQDRLADFGRLFKSLSPKNRKGVRRDMTGILDVARLRNSRGGWAVFCGWLVADTLFQTLHRRTSHDGTDASRSDDFFEEFHFQDGLAGAFRPLTGEDFLASRNALIVRTLMKGKGHLSDAEAGDWQAVLYRFLRDEQVRTAIGVNEYGGIRYFHRESFAEILGYFVAISLYYAGRDTGFRGKVWTGWRDAIIRRAATILTLSETLGHRYDGLMGFVSGGEIPRQA